MYDRYFKEKETKPKLPMGIQKPTYKLPDNSNYAAWCEWMLQRHKVENAHKLLPKEETEVIQFHEAIGVKSFTQGQ